MPASSNPQHKAMFAAAEGKSTLGIPKKVGEEFAAKDATGHAAGILYVAPDGDVLLLRRSSTETNYAGHWALPGGKSEDGETPVETAAREAREEMGETPDGSKKLLDSRVTPTGMAFHTFAQPVESKFVPTLNDEHSGYAWAPLDQLPGPMHPAVKSTLDDRLNLGADMSPEDWTGLRSGFAKWTREEERETEHAQDEARLALDDRQRDQDGHMRVPSSVISAAQVNDYRAEEIPNWRDLGLVAGRVYALLRDPVELEAGMPSLHGKPLLIVHKAVTAEDHDREVVVGSVQNPVWESPNIKAEISVWDGEGIEAITSSKQKDLSAGYRYDPVMTPGEFNGVHYDGRMTNIRFNHVALVKIGRVIGAFVGDEAIQQESMTMTKAVLTRKAAVAKGALLAHLRPILAVDAKIDLTPVLSKLTAENFKAEIPNVIAGVEKLAKGKMAKDAKLEGLDVLLGAIAMDETMEEKEDKAPAKDGEEGGLKGFLKGKMSEDDYKAACDMMEAEDGEEDDDAEDEEEEDDKGDAPAKKPAKDKGAKDRAKDGMVTKGAMDAALKSATETTAKLVRETERGIRAALADIRPWVGELSANLAFDSAEDVYKAALEARGKSTKGIHPSAYRAILEVLPKPGADRPAQPRIGMDSAGAKSFDEMYPGAMKIGVNA